MAALHLILAISFEELYMRRDSFGVALEMTFNRLVVEKRTLGLDLDDEEADCFCFLHGKSTIRSLILLVLS